MLVAYVEVVVVEVVLESNFRARHCSQGDVSRVGARDSAGYPDLKRPQAKSFKTLTLSETGLQPTALTPHAHFTDTHNTAALYKTLQLGFRMCTDEHLPDTLLVGPGEKMKAGWDKSGVGMSVSLAHFPVLMLGCLQSVFYVHVC